MQYQTFTPPIELADVVEHFWVVENPVALDAHRELLIPNGRPTILICIGDPGIRIEVDGTSRPNASNAAGLITRPIILEQSGVSSYVGAQLKPWGLSQLGFPSLVDDCQRLKTLIGRERTTAIILRCSSEPFGKSRTVPLIDLLRSLTSSCTQSHLDEIQAAIQAIDEQAGLVEVEALSAGLKISYDRLYRRFKSMLGLSPKQYASIIRFYGFTTGLLKDDLGSLAQLASLQGYYDQAHAAREFKRYTGVSQGRFRQTLNGIAKLMQIRGEPSDSYNS